MVMERLIEQVLKNNDKNIKIKSVLADDDGAYERNNNFQYLQKKMIQSGIKG